jgi:hypothetical protein
MKKTLLTLALLSFALLPLNYAVAQDSTGDWTEMSFTVFDQIDGEFSPHLAGGVVNFIGGKGIGAYLGEDNAVGPLMLWKVWGRTFGAVNVSIFSVASSDVGNAGEVGLFNNGTIGLEPRFYWEEFGNASIGLGLLSTTFVEGEKAQMTPYFKLIFRP